MVDISTITSDLEEHENGIWVSRRQGPISYPEGGNEDCFAVEDESYWFRHRNNVITHLVSQYSSSKIFFDIGGGNGCVSHALKLAGNDVVLVEPGPTGALNAKKRGVPTVVQSTLEDAGFENESLPSAGLFDVVEHIENDVPFLQMIHNYLQPQGTVFITVPAFQFLWSNDDIHAGHYRRYTTRSLSKLLEGCGFETQYCSYLFSFLVPPIFLLRTIPSRMGFRKSMSQSTTQKEHSAGKGIINSSVQSLLHSELGKIKSGKSLWFGSSCIAAARKRAV